MNTNAIPGKFWFISILATLWYVMGCLMWYMQIAMGPEALGQLTPGEQDFYSALPGWYNIVFGVAVFAGLVACIALLMRRRVALPLFIASLIAVVVQDLYGFGVLNAMALLGTASIVVPILVIGIGIVMIWFTRSCNARGYLT